MARKLTIIALVVLSAALSQLVGRSSAAPELALSPSLAPRAGDLDPSFDRDGKVITDFGGSETASAVAVQADGKVIAAGSARDPAANTVSFALARYNRNGNLDSAFGSGGKVRTDFARPSSASALSIQPDGRIVVAGDVGINADFDFALARYNRDGTLDSTFGIGGKVTTDLSQVDAAYAVAIQADGRIVVAGGTRVAPRDYDFAVVRYNANGRLDPSFGGVGAVITPFTPGYDHATAVLVQPDGKLVTAGVADATPQSTHLALARYNPDGTLDQGFGGDGKVEEAEPGGWGFSIAIQKDAKLVVADGAGIARFNANGSPDTGFGSRGKVVLARRAWAYAVLVQSDRKLVVAGGYQPWPNVDFLVARFQPDGSKDTSFADSGRVTTDLAKSSADLAYAAVLQPDRRIVVVGSTAPDSQSPSDFALVRYLNPAPCKVPNVRGKKLALARSAIMKSHCRVGRVKRKASRKVKRDRVISQSPKAGRQLPNRGRVNLVVSRGRK